MFSNFLFKKKSQGVFSVLSCSVFIGIHIDILYYQKHFFQEDLFVHIYYYLLLGWYHCYQCDRR